MMVPVTHHHVLPVGGFDEGQDACQQFGVGVALQCFIGLDVDRNDQDGSGFGLPYKGLI